jgi:regulator of protease activity HflC (stomatin/prohibitin superfamily)
LDERNVVLSSIVRYHIYDVEKFLLGVMHANDVLIDTTQGIIREIVEDTRWDDLVDLTNRVTPAVNKQVKKWGITVQLVSFPDLGEITTYRIISDPQKNSHNILPINV